MNAEDIFDTSKLELRRTVLMKAKRRIEPGQLVTDADVEPLPPVHPVTELLEAFVDAAGRRHAAFTRGIGSGMGMREFARSFDWSAVTVEPAPIGQVWSVDSPVRDLNAFAAYLAGGKTYSFVIEVKFKPATTTKRPRIPVQLISEAGGYVSSYLTQAFASVAFDVNDDVWSYTINGTVRLAVAGFVRIGRSDEPIKSPITSLRLKWSEL